MNKVDYSKSKIYKLVSKQTDKCYIGSTTKQYLCQRLWGHKASMNTYNSGNKHSFMSSFEILKYDDVDIILIENFPCKSKDELRSRERYWIEKTNCVNLRIPIRKNDERKTLKKERDRKYIENNKEKFIEYQRKYREEHRENNKEYQKQYRLKKNQENEKVKENLDINNNDNGSTTILQ